MIDEKKIVQHNMEMTVHADGAAPYLNAQIGGKFVTREQARDLADYVLAQTKRNIERCPFASQEEKETEIRRREYLIYFSKSQMGL